MTHKPEWKKVVAGKHRCQDCGQFVSVAWKLFVAPAEWTMCFCEDCTEERIAA